MSHTHRPKSKIMYEGPATRQLSSIELVLHFTFLRKKCARAELGLFVRGMHTQRAPGDRSGRERPDRGPREQVPLSSVCA